MSYVIYRKKPGIHHQSLNSFAKKSKIVEDVETPKKCPNCFSFVGRAHNHSPNSCKSSSTILDNLEQQLPPDVQEKFASRIIDKAEKTQLVSHCQFSILQAASLSWCLKDQILRSRSKLYKQHFSKWKGN